MVHLLIWVLSFITLSALTLTLKIIYIVYDMIPNFVVSENSFDQVHICALIIGSGKYESQGF